MVAGTWYTLVRFRDTPRHLTGVTQAKTTGDAMQLLQGWEEAFPADTVVVFDPANAPVTRAALARDCATK